ncbi:MAG: endolytic transglycosylase MltG [Candidatus Peribacteria bacterium]|nr:endolytic transglycosylase MltG [Candidatus Peribacteria bacterium]
MTHLAKGPEKEFVSYTVLEGRSIYDIDDDLAKKGYIQPGEYIAYTTNPEKISELAKRYDFFDQNLKSLEGFLYPDTYYLDNWGNLVNQLVSIQLNTFKKKVREPHSSDFSKIQQKYGLNTYQTITLASVIEKEEKADNNKPTIAGVFYNRLQKGMLLGADITLCYNFQQPYTSCTSSVIAKNVADATNPYNTRQVAGLPPTPIGNPNVATIQAALTPKQTAYLFYLHDAQGGIHYGETNADHEKNKAQYL